jgi:hypothetical protein
VGNWLSQGSLRRKPSGFGISEKIYTLLNSSTFSEGPGLGGERRS